MAPGEQPVRRADGATASAVPSPRPASAASASSPSAPPPPDPDDAAARDGGASARDAAPSSDDARSLRARRDGASVERPAGVSRAELFDQAFHLGPAALMVIRLDDGVVLDASDPMLDLTGYAAGDLIGQPVGDLPLWPTPRAHRTLARELLAEGALYHREVEIRRADGTARTVLGDAKLATIGEAPCVLLSAIDVTRRKEALRAEQESRALLLKIFHASPAAIAICHLHDDRYLDANEGFAALLDIDRDDLMRQDPASHWADPAHRRALFRQLSREEAIYDEQVELVAASGASVTVLASFQRIQVGHEPCVLVVMTDITSREAQRRALVEARDRAEEARQRAEEIALFRSAVLQNMTHEVRTPLTVILGFTSMLREGVEPRYERFVSLIERSGRRLLLTLDSLIDLAHIESGTMEMEREVYDVREVVHGATANLSSLVEEKDLAFTLNTPDTRVPVTLDYELFKRVLHHFIDNAIKFTDEGGVTVTAEADDAFVYIRVTDTGMGIDEAFMPRIFEAFSQESEGIARTHQGSGLGLTVAKRLTEAMDGRITVKSTKGEGSTFSVVFPRADRKDARPRLGNHKAS
jgi:PAS domain S-box-containing protein